jgi:DNA-binding GntR family transcriptional regulator
VTTEPGTEFGLRKSTHVHQSLKGDAYSQIREAILSGSLAPGSLSSAPALAEALGMSRSPVREALVDLAKDGLVVFERNRGVRIVKQDRHDVEEVFELRLLLEVHATRLAVMTRGGGSNDFVNRLRVQINAMESHLDDEPSFMVHDRAFHEIILDGSGNHRLTAFVLELRDQVRSFGLSTVGRSRSLAEVLAEHEEILRAVETGDADDAAARMDAHVRHTGELLLAQAITNDSANRELDQSGETS